jgi:tetratricopeptide (TPR) repeat protein
MKTKFFIILITFLSFAANAQEKFDCTDSEKQFSKMLFERDFAKANNEWPTVKKNCLNSSESYFRLGAELLQYNIDVAPDTSKEKPVRELVELYELFDKTFPNNHNGNLVRKAMALYDNKVGSNAEILQYLEAAFNYKKDDFNNPKALYVYFQMYYTKYTEGKSGITDDNLIEKYLAVTALSESNSLKYNDKKEEYTTLISGVKSIVYELLTCDRLVSYAQKNFETNKTNTDWLSGIVLAMSDKCASKPIFETIALQWNQLKPSSKSAFYLANYYNTTKNTTKALDYFQQSVALATSNDEKATTSYTIASILANTDKAKAREQLMVAIQNQPKNGKYFIFLANLYANATECAANEQERKALYQLAYNTVQKAKQIEPKYTQTVANISKGFLKSRGEVTELKNKTVKIGCWINESISF